jgi:hypothetical protein
MELVKKLSLAFILLIWTAEFLIRAQCNGSIAKKKDCGNNYDFTLI